MQTFRLRDGDDFIKLGQLLKAAGIAENGGEAKEIILEGKVSVNGQAETRRGRKICAGDLVSCSGEEIRVEE